MRIQPLTIAAQKAHELGPVAPEGATVTLELHAPNGCLIRLLGDVVGENVVFSSMFLSGIGSRGKARVRSLAYLKSALQIGASYEFCNLDDDEQR